MLSFPWDAMTDDESSYCHISGQYGKLFSRSHEKTISTIIYGTSLSRNFVKQYVYRGGSRI